MTGGPAERGLTTGAADVGGEPPALVGVAAAGVTLAGVAGVAVAGVAAAGRAAAGVLSAGAASAASPVFGSTSDIICRKVLSSMGRSVFPSQVDPSGTRFCTVEAAAST